MSDTRRIISPEEFGWAYARLSKLTPLKSDCGDLCGKSCCKGLDERAGMYLFPGEEAMFSPDMDWLALDWHLVSEREFCPSWEGSIEKVGFVVCRGTCPRDQRPLACRLFPLVAEPVVAKPGVARPAVAGPACAGFALDVVVDSSAALLCPLARYAKLEQLDARFVKACREVYLLLARDPLILDDFLWQSERRRLEAGEPWRDLLR